jgi:tetratricopeptide (TPR) repeat protein
LFETAGLLREGINQFELLIREIKGREQIQGWESALGQALAQQSLLYFRKGAFDQAKTLLEESLSILRPLGDQAILVDPLTYLGIIQHLNGDLERSRSILEEGLACAQDVGDQWFEAYAIYNLGYIASLEGRYEEGYEQMSRGLSVWQKLGDPWSIALGYNFLGTTLIKLGRFEEATANLQESIRLCEEAGNRWGAGTAHRYLGLAKMAQGNLDEAKSLILLGEATMAEGRLEEAWGIFLDALQKAQDAKSLPLELDALLGLAKIRAMEGDYERAVRLSSFIQNHVNSTQDTKNRARQLLSDAEKQISPSQWDEAREKAANQSLEEILEELTFKT